MCLVFTKLPKTGVNIFTQKLQVSRNCNAWHCLKLQYFIPSCDISLHSHYQTYTSFNWRLVCVRWFSVIGSRLSDAESDGMCRSKCYNRFSKKKEKTLYIFLEANPTLKAILPGTIDESSILPILSRLEWLKFKHLSSTGHMLYCTFWWLKGSNPSALNANDRHRSSPWNTPSVEWEM